MIPDAPAPTPEATGLPPLRPDAIRVVGATRRGRPCALVDNTGEALPEEELKVILTALIEQDRFGFRAASASGASTLTLDQPDTAHVQIGAKLYRLIVARYEARIEPF